MAGNWKMYKNPSETAAFFDSFKPLVAQSSHCEIVICPPSINVPAAVAAVKGTAIGIGTQNIYWAKEGAFTGELSAPMVKAAGAEWTIVGHSERRQYFGETDEWVFKKTVAALEAGLKPIVCVGEMLADREAGQTEKVLAQQFEGGLSKLTPEQFAQIVIAYEPVWAIGTGKTATTEQAQSAHAFIRSLLARHFDDTVARRVRIQYGGSVKPANARELMSQPDVDGALVGGAALEVRSFADIVKNSI
jgi:triosephosphate isomerase